MEDNSQLLLYGVKDIKEEFEEETLYGNDQRPSKDKTKVEEKEDFSFFDDSFEFDEKSTFDLPSDIANFINEGESHSQSNSTLVSQPSQSSNAGNVDSSFNSEDLRYQSSIVTPFSSSSVNLFETATKLLDSTKTGSKQSLNQPQNLFCKSSLSGSFSEEVTYQGNLKSINNGSQNSQDDSCMFQKHKGLFSSAKDIPFNFQNKNVSLAQSSHTQVFGEFRSRNIDEVRNPLVRPIVTSHKDSLRRPIFQSSSNTINMSEIGHKRKVDYDECTSFDFNKENQGSNNLVSETEKEAFKKQTCLDFAENFSFSQPEPSRFAIPMKSCLRKESVRKETSLDFTEHISLSQPERSRFSTPLKPSSNKDMIGKETNLDWEDNIPSSQPEKSQFAVPLKPCFKPVFKKPKVSLNKQSEALIPKVTVQDNKELSQKCQAPVITKKFPTPALANTKPKFGPSKQLIKNLNSSIVKQNKENIDQEKSSNELKETKTVMPLEKDKPMNESIEIEILHKPELTSIPPQSKDKRKFHRSELGSSKIENFSKSVTKVQNYIKCIQNFKVKFPGLYSKVDSEVSRPNPSENSKCKVGSIKSKLHSKSSVVDANPSSPDSTRIKDACRTKSKVVSKDVTIKESSSPVSTSHTCIEINCASDEEKASENIQSSQQEVQMDESGTQSSHEIQLAHLDEIKTESAQSDTREIQSEYTNIDETQSTNSDIDDNQPSHSDAESDQVFSDEEKIQLPVPKEVGDKSNSLGSVNELHSVQSEESFPSASQKGNDIKSLSPGRVETQSTSCGEGSGSEKSTSHKVVQKFQSAVLSKKCVTKRCVSKKGKKNKVRSSSGLSKKERLAKLASLKEHLYHLQDITEFPVWVQCDDCRKWRCLRDVMDPAVLPNHWTCSLNSDDSFASCDIPEENFDQSEHDRTFTFNMYTLGSVVWVTSFGPEWWPAMVDDDPDTDTFFWLPETSNEPNYYHVTFFGVDVSRSWVRSNCIVPFHAGKGRKSITTKKWKKALEDATKEAHLAMTLPLPERRRVYCFASRYRGKWFINPE